MKPMDGKGSMIVGKSMIAHVECWGSGQLTIVKSHQEVKGCGHLVSI